MKCPQCGKKIKGDKACKRCGYASFENVTQKGQLSSAYCLYEPIDPSHRYVVNSPVSNEKNGKKAKGTACCRKNVASRLFAIVMIAVCVLAFTVVPYYIIQASGVALANSGIEMTKGLFASTGRMFGFVPAFTVKGTLGMLYNVAIYVFLLCSVLALIISVFAVFSRKSAPRRVRRALFFLGVGALFYSVMFILTTRKLYPDLKMAESSILSFLPFTVDFFSLAIGIVCLLLSFFFLIFRRKNK